MQIGKEGKDLIGKEYPENKQFEFSTSTSDDLSFKVTTAAADATNVDGEIELKGDGMSVKGTWNDAGVFGFETNVKSSALAVDGLNLTISGDTEKPKGAGFDGSMTAEVTYQMDMLSAKVESKVSSVNDATQVATTVGLASGSGPMSAGISLGLTDANLKSANFSAEYVEKGSYSGALLATNVTAGDKMGIGLRAVLYPSSDVTTALMVETKNMKPSSAKVGLKYVLDAETTLRAKVASDLGSKNTLGLSYQQQLKKGATFTVGAAMPVSNPADVSVGFSLTVE